MWSKNKPQLGAKQNWRHPLSKGLVSHWLMNEGGSGKVLDLVKNNHGTVTLATIANGKFGKCLNFDLSTTQYVTLSSTSLTAGSPFSLSWWEKINNNINAYPSRFNLPMSGTSNFFVVIRIQSDAAYASLTWGISPNSNSSIKSSGVPSVASSVGIWRHIVITGINPNSTTVADYNVYVDGVSYVCSQGGTYGTITNNRIGFDGFDHGTDASMDDIRIYNRALSFQEVKQLYNNPFADVRPSRNSWSLNSISAGGNPFSARAPYMKGVLSIKG